MTEDPRVRIGHCCPDAPNVDIHVDGTAAYEDVAFGDVSDYTSLESGDHQIQVIPSGGGDAVIEANLELESETAYTVLATGMLEDIKPTVFPDAPGEVPSDMTHLRFIHASPDAPEVSISVVGGSELFSDVGFREASGYEPVDAGTYDLEVRPTGQDEVVLGLDGVTLEGGAANSAIAIGQVSDESLTAIMADDAMMRVPADD